MSAFTGLTDIKEVPAPAGGDGLKYASFKLTGPTSYDTGGSVADLSSIFSGTVRGMTISTESVAHRAQYVYVATYSTSPKIIVDDNAGTQIASTTDLSSTPGAFYCVAWGTDN